MTKYIKEYIDKVNNKLKGQIKEEDILELKDKILFFSHERLIHLIVTMFFAIFTIFFVFIGMQFNNLLYIVLSLIFLVILIFYIFHYYFLENSVQSMYKLYDEMLKKKK